MSNMILINFFFFFLRRDPDKFRAVEQAHLTKLYHISNCVFCIKPKDYSNIICHGLGLERIKRNKVIYS